MKRHWTILIILLFVTFLILVAVLAASWNVVLLEQYESVKNLANSLSIDDLKNRVSEYGKIPWLGIVLGSLGFVSILSIVVLFFVLLVRQLILNQRQTDFLARVTHELRTPIATIELMSTLIRSNHSWDEATESAWKLLNDELVRLKTEVETLLESARWQTHLPTLQSENVHLESWIQSHWERWEQILGPGATLAREGTPLDFSIHTDPQILELILNNLLGNARKFSINEPRVRIHTECVPPQSSKKSLGSWKLVVIDSGLGFSPDAKDRIFRRFYRSPIATKHSISGTGLGLHLAKQAAKRLKISLSAQSEGHNQGASFQLEGRWI